MAVTLTRPTSISLGTAVKSRLESFKKARADLQVEDEMNFLKQVSEKGMSNAEQLAYRQGQLEREQKRNVPDQDYIVSLTKEITDLKKLARYEKLREAYTSSITDVASGRKSLQDHLQLLRTQLNETNDPDLKKELQDQLYQTQKDITQSAQDLLDNQVEFANKDKTLSVLDSTISKVKTEKAKALGIGDDKRASALDLKLQSLEQTRSVTQVQDTVNKLNVSKARKASAIAYLQDLSAEVSNADSNTPIVINGTRYNSEQDFWSQQRDQYISTNFFTDLNKEYSDYVTSVSQLNGKVPDTILRNIQSDFTQIAQRPEMAAYIPRLDIAKTSVLANAVGKTADSVLNQFATDNDAQGALAILDNLQTKFGIDQTLNAQKIIQDVAKEKGAVVQNLLGEVTARVASGMSYSNALSDVNKSLGKGEILAPTYSAKDLATKSPQELLGGAQPATQQNLKTGAPNLPSPGATQTPPTPAQSIGATQPAPFEGLQMPGQTGNQPAGSIPATLTQQPGQVLGASVTAPVNPSEYTVASGDTLSGIAKKLLGDARKYTLIFEANKDIIPNPSLIKPGQKLKIPSNI